MDDERAKAALAARAGYAPPMNERVILERDGWRMTEDEGGVIRCYDLSGQPAPRIERTFTVRLENSLIGDGYPAWDPIQEFFEVLRELVAARDAGMRPAGNPVMLVGVRGTRVCITNSCLMDGEELIPQDAPVSIEYPLGE